MESPPSDDLDSDQLLGWLEFGCWSALVMAPVIYRLQGASVSHDQFVVRTALVIVAAIGGALSRVIALIRQRRFPAHDEPPQSQAGKIVGPEIDRGTL